MRLHKNLLLKSNIKEEVVERILWIDHTSTYCATIDVNHKNALPEINELSSINRLLEDGSIKILERDSFGRYLVENELTSSEITIRNNRWDAIKELIDLEPDIFDSAKRWKLIEKNCGDNYPTTVLKHLRVYWQRGCTMNALLPDYKNSGNRGLPKKLKDKKTGRPKKYNTKNEGINVTPEVEYYFSEGIKKFKESNSIKIIDIYRFILNEYFVENISYENGKKKITLKQEIPSIRQFRYWYNKNSNSSAESKAINRKGSRRYLLEDRPVLGTSDQYISAPGLKYQIDSTPADIQLVSEKDPDLIIGRPTIYFVVDVFSRMIVGMYVSLQNASWSAASMALINTAMNKVDYCKQFDIDISEDEWPTHYLPESILADRAEFKGYKTEQLISGLGIRVENTPSYRADYKGIVEQSFNKLNRKLKPNLPGVVNKDSGARGQRDPKLDARLTIKECTQAVIQIAMFYNNYNWLKTYEVDEEMIADRVPSIPIELWRWGVKRRSGKLRTFPMDMIKLNLLPRRNATITKNGIHFTKQIFYTCLRAEREGWYQDASINGSWKVEIAYDPRSVNQIYIVNKDGTYEVCYLLEQYKTYQDIQYDELELLRENRKSDEKGYEHSELEKEIDLDNYLKELADKGQKRHKQKTKEPNKSEKIKNIRENRKDELQEANKKEAFILDEVNKYEIEQDGIDYDDEINDGTDYLLKMIMKHQEGADEDD